MIQVRRLLGALALTGTVLMVSGFSAQALSMSECSAKYKEAKAAGTLKGGWADFRKSVCGAEAKSAAGSEAKGAATPAAATVTTASPAKFPAAIDPKYSGEPVAKGRMKTCVDQYNANKGSNANGGMKWIQKGGGYYSLCNKRLKGAV